MEKNQINPPSPIHPFVVPLASRNVFVGETLLANAKRSLAIDNSFGHSFTHGPIFQVSRLMVDLPGAMAAEVAFNNRNVLDVIVVKIQESTYQEVIDQLIAHYPDKSTVAGDEVVLDLGQLVVAAEPKGYGKYPCVTVMTPEFYQARQIARSDAQEKTCVA